MNVYVLDACAVIAYLNQEEGADEVDNILAQADYTRLISIINVYEVCYDAARVSGFDEGIKLYQEIQNLPITIVREIEEEAMKHAIHLNPTHPESDDLYRGRTQRQKP